jgi:hypothetical protein
MGNAAPHAHAVVPNARTVNASHLKRRAQSMIAARRSTVFTAAACRLLAG